jgi:hypothetical protein
VMTVVKMRASPPSKELREYEVDEKGITVASGPLDAYRGILTGAPVAATAGLAKRLESEPPP